MWPAKKNSVQYNDKSKDTFKVTLNLDIKVQFCEPGKIPCQAGVNSRVRQLDGGNSKAAKHFLSMGLANYAALW